MQIPLKVKIKTTPEGGNRPLEKSWRTFEQTLFALQVRTCRWPTISEQEWLTVFPVYQSTQPCIECLQVIES